jgi:hypothetical protein
MLKMRFATGRGLSNAVTVDLAEGSYVTANTVRTLTALSAADSQAIFDAMHKAGMKPTEEPCQVPNRYTINGRPISDYMSPDPRCRTAGYNTALGYLAKVNPEALALIGDILTETQRDGFWLMHKCRRKGITPIKVKAPAVLRENGIYTVNMYPVELLRERFGE